MAKGRGGGKTPERVVDLISRAVAEKSQSAVARESGLALLTVQRYLKGLGEPTDETLQKLADYFKVSVPWLRGDSFWTYEEERQLHEWNLLTEDEREQINSAKIKEHSENIARIKGEIAIHETAGAELLLKHAKLESDYEKYRELIISFMSIPVEEMDDAIDILRVVQKSRLENPDLLNPPE